MSVDASPPGDDVTASSMTKHQPSYQISNVQPKIEMSNEISAHEISNESVTNSPSSAVSPKTSVADRSSDKASSEVAAGIARNTSNGALTLKKISSSISASETVRLLCSVVIALLVVLAYHGYSMGLGRIASYRPLLLVFLTDATVIVGVLLANQGNKSNGDGAASSTGKWGDAWDVGRMLEAALVLQKALGAIFLDCSICAVIMICGVVV